jgi:mRNA-degrading endonuclease RelE of RelBE toxin-antitoxin system
LRDYSKFKITVRDEPRFASFFQSLRDEELRERIDGVLSTLKEHPDAGDLVERSLWPDEYKKMELTNLFRMKVGKSQRIIYTIQIEGSNLDVNIIEFFRTHKEYERRLHY